MSLTKATQNVIDVNICTTDTSQVITGGKTFSQLINGSVTGTSSSLSNSKTIQIAGDIVANPVVFNGSSDISLISSFVSGANIPSPNIFNSLISNPTITGGSISSSSISGATINSPVFSGTATGSVTSNVIQGVTDGSSAAIGYIGQIISSTIGVGSAVSLTSGTTANVTSITLTAGDWYVNGQVDYRASVSTNITVLTQGISQTSATIGTQDTFTRLVTTVVPTASNDIGLPIREQRISTSSNVTIYLVCNTVFSGAGQTLSAYGTIEARRIR